jgi:hypothetical protein
MGVRFSLFTDKWDEDDFASYVYFTLPLLIFLTATWTSAIDDCYRQALIQHIGGRQPDRVAATTAVTMRGEWVEKVKAVGDSVANLSSAKKNINISPV